MYVFGTESGRRVRLEISGRTKKVRLVDDDTESEIDSQLLGSDTSSSLSGSTLQWSGHTIMLDRGEEVGAAELLRVADGSRATARQPSDLPPPQSGTVGSHIVIEDEYSDYELRREMRRQSVIGAARRAVTVANVLSAVIFISGGLMLIAGLWAVVSRYTVASQEGKDVSVGIGFLIAGVVQLCVGLMLTEGVATVANYIRYKAEFDPIE